MDGLLVIRKPAGITSFEALGPIKRYLGTSRMGHAGTLDKFAEGVLLVLSGKMTRLVPYFMELEKEYEAVIEFGTETDTLDPEGNIVRKAGLPSEETVHERIRSFTGKLMQSPPAYSAVHVNGARAYKLARSGETVTLPPREVTVFDFSPLGYAAPELTAKIRCSKGTYIRSLARDLGEACGSCAFVKRLVRTKIGDFSYDDGCPPDRISADAIMTPRRIFERLPSVSVLTIAEGHLDDIYHGRILKNGMFLKKPERNGTYAVFSGSELFLGLVEYADEAYEYRFAAGRPAR